MSGETPNFSFYHGEPILPPSEQRGKGTVEKLQKKYPLRYKLYCQEDEAQPVDGASPEVIVRRLQMLNNLDRYITAHGRPGRGRVLREKQLAVFRDTHDFLETGETEGYVEAPTGFGKTVLFSEIVKATDQKTLVVVPSRLLVEQTYERLKQFNPTLEIGRYYSDKKERNKQVIITTYKSLAISCGGVRPEDIDLLILDEVHQSLTDVRIEAVERFINPVKLGFTATPEYTKDKRVENLLNNLIHSVTLREAVETGLLCSFSVFLAETNVDLSNISINNDGDYNDRELEEAINIYSRNKSAVDLYQKLNEEHTGLSKAVTYCVSIRHAQEVARLFNEADIPAAAIWSDQDKDERRRMLEAYGRGEIKVITNVNVLTEGFDDPQAALCLNLRPTLSTVVAKQRGGRVLRLDPDNSRKHAIVVDYLDRNENKRTTQVTFAQVADDAQIINPFIIDTDGIGTGGNGNGKEDKVLVDREQFDLEGIHVITNSQEVLRIVKELENPQGGSGLEDVKGTDFPITVDSLDSFFCGDVVKVMQLARVILDELKKQDPSLVTKRMVRAFVVDAITDRDLFINRMLEKGVALKKDIPDKLQPNELPLTEPSLLAIFKGYRVKLMEFAKRVKDKLEAENSNFIQQRLRGHHVIPVAVDRDRFISEMLAEGLILKEPSAEVQSNTEIALNQRYHQNIFRGESRKISTASQEVIKLLSTTYPDMFARRRRKESGRVVDAITDKKYLDLYIEAMVKKGIKLKDTNKK